MDYRIKRLIGTIFTTVLVLFVWALLTGTVHAQSRASNFTNAQLFQALPDAMRECRFRIPNSPECNAVTNITAELLNRGAVRNPATPVLEKLQVLVSLNEMCVRLHVCAHDAAVINAAFLRQLAVNGITPDAYIRVYEAHFADLAALAPITYPTLVETFATFQQARNGF